MTLFDLVEAAQRITDDDREVVAILDRLIHSGRVKHAHGGPVRQTSTATRTAPTATQ